MLVEYGRLKEIRIGFELGERKDPIVWATLLYCPEKDVTGFQLVAACSFCNIFAPTSRLRKVLSVFKDLDVLEIDRESQEVFATYLANLYRAMAFDLDFLRAYASYRDLRKYLGLPRGRDNLKREREALFGQGVRKYNPWLDSLP